MLKVFTQRKGGARRKKKLKVPKGFTIQCPLPQEQKQLITSLNNSNFEKLSFKQPNFGCRNSNQINH